METEKIPKKDNYKAICFYSLHYLVVLHKVVVYNIDKFYEKNNSNELSNLSIRKYHKKW